MSNSMHDIVKRLAVLEGRITPAEPKGSQNSQQKSVNQLPALFKPGKGGPILGGDPDKKAVTKGYFVGAESAGAGVKVVDQDYDLDQMVLSLDVNGKKASFTYWDYDEDFKNAERKEVFAQLEQQPWFKGLDHPTKMEVLDASWKAITGQEPSEYRPRVGDEPMNDVDILGEEQANEEKLLDRVKKSFIDYLDSVEDAVNKNKDRDISSKPADRAIGKKTQSAEIQAKETAKEEKLDEILPALGAVAARALVGSGASALTRTAAGAVGHAAGAAAQDALNKNEDLDEDPTQTEPASDTATAPIQEPTYAAQSSAPVKTMTLEDGRVCEIHGDEHRGFEIRHGNRKLPSRFKNLDHATMAMEMYQAHCRARNESADYIDEA